MTLCCRLQSYVMHVVTEVQVVIALAWAATTRCLMIHSKDDSTALTQVYCGAAQNDLQAQARAHRLGQTRTVMIYRCAARHCSETPAQPGVATLWQMV